MKGLKIIPMFLVLMIMTYGGMLFVQANNTEVVVKLGHYESQPVATGFVVLTSVFIGMLLCGALCSIELLALYMQNKRLKRKLMTPPAPKAAVAPMTEDIVNHRTSGRFT